MELDAGGRYVVRYTGATWNSMRETYDLSHRPVGQKYATNNRDVRPSISQCPQTHLALIFSEKQL